MKSQKLCMPAPKAGKLIVSLLIIALILVSSRTGTTHSNRYACYRYIYRYRITFKSR